MGVKTPIHIELDPAERQELEIWARSQAMPHRMVSRAKIIWPWRTDRRSQVQDELLDVDAGSHESGRSDFGSNA
jgi:hypothetical protein